MMTYCVEYRLNIGAGVKAVSLPAKNKVEAYDKAVFEVIKEKEGSLPYSAWVASVTYSNGNRKRFNTFEGKPY